MHISHIIQPKFEKTSILQIKPTKTNRATEYQSIPIIILCWLHRKKKWCSQMAKGELSTPNCCDKASSVWPYKGPLTVSDKKGCNHIMQVEKKNAPIIMQLSHAWWRLKQKPKQTAMADQGHNVQAMIKQSMGFQSIILNVSSGILWIYIYTCSNDKHKNFCDVRNCTDPWKLGTRNSNIQ